MHIRKKIKWSLILAMVLFLTGTSPAFAQNDTPAEGEDAQPLTWENFTLPDLPGERVDPAVDPALATPLRCFMTFRDAMIRNSEGETGALADAASCFDMTVVDEGSPAVNGESIALQLAGIIDNINYISPLDIVDDPLGPASEIFSSDAGKIEITMGEDGAWRFSRESVAAIPLIYTAMESAGKLINEFLSKEYIPQVDPKFASARACYETYMAAMVRVQAGDTEYLAEAVECFDLPEEILPVDAEDISRKLYGILQSPSITFDPDDLDDVEEGTPGIIYTHPLGIIEIVQLEDLSWRISRGSIEAIPAIRDEILEAAMEQDSLLDLDIDEEIPQELATPLRCYLTFRDAMEKYNGGDAEAIKIAVTCLDLSEVEGTAVQEYGKQIAERLDGILAEIPQDFIDLLADDPEGPRGVVYQHDAGSITISQSEDGAWRFSRDSVSAIPDIYLEMEAAGEVEKIGIRKYIPNKWLGTTFLIEDWQWLVLLLLILLGMVLDRVVPIFVGHGLRLWLRKTTIGADKEFIKNTSRPFGFLAMSAFWWVVIGSMGMELKVLAILLTAVKFMTAWGIVWCAYRSVDIVSEFIERRASETESRMDDLLAPFVRKSLKVFVTVFGIVFVASNINVDVTSLLAGLGIGGLALALAAQDTLANLFGSITVLFDRPFQVGDWVVIDEVEGTVEEVGFRSTRIRTFYNSLITVPNSKLISASVDNMGERTFRRISTHLSITYETPPEKIEAFCEAIRELIRIHPYTRKDYFHVWLNRLGASSLDILLYCFLKTPDWATELREKHRLFLDIIRVAQELGIEFAYPTEVQYIAEKTAPQPVFPGEGSIKSSVDSQYKNAAERAREITISGLGGKNVIPDPVRFKDAGSFSDDDGDG